MGLSDGERTKGIFACVRSLYELRGFKEELYKPLNRLLKNLWPALLASGSNSGLYWILGGQMSNDYFAESGLISHAFSNVLHNFYEGGDKDPLREGLSKDMRDWLEYRDHYAPTMIRLLEQEPVWNSRKLEHAHAMEAFLISESYMYYVNRYDDALSKSLRPVSELIATIQGECYRIFSTNPIFMASFMAEKIFDKILTWDQDTAGAWFRKHNLHHHVRLNSVPLPKLREVFQEVRKAGYKLTTQRQLEIVLLFVGKAYHYAHQHRELYKMIEEHNKKLLPKAPSKKSKKKVKPTKKVVPADLINLDAIKTICAANTVAHAAGEKENMESYRKNRYCFLFQEDLNPDDSGAKS